MRRWRLFAVIIFAEAIGHAQVIGTVVSTQGTWCDQAHQQCAARDFGSLWRLYPVQRDSRLMRTGSINGRESVTIRSRWGALEKFDCSNPRELGCKGPLDLSRLIPATPQKNVVTAFFDAVLELAADRPQMYDAVSQGILRTRGEQAHRLTDGVAALTQKGLRLDNVIGDLDPGDYLLQLCPLDNSAKPQCSDTSKPMKYNWDPKTKPLLAAGNLQPGLYRLYLCDPDSEAHPRTCEHADLLVAEDTRADQLAKDFLEVRLATEGWDSEDPTSPALRRAYLYKLAGR
jgi:hypothetical protein